MDRCRIGFVGAGGVAQRHARMLARIPEADVAVVTDPDPEARDRFAVETGARAVDGVAKLLAAGVDAVYVCVPPFAHGPIEESVAAAGKPVFVEKPLGLDLATAERVGAALGKAGVVTAVGHHWRYSRPVARARELLDGRPARLVVGSWLDKVPPPAWWTRRDGSGGQIVEQAVHVLDLARVLVGEVVEVAGIVDPRPPDGAGSADIDGADIDGADIDGATAALLRFDTGAVGTLSATCRLGWKHRAGLEVVADGLVVSVAEDGIVVRDGVASSAEQVDPDTARFAADRAFVDAVLGRSPSPEVAGCPVPVDYAEALRTHRLACAVAEAAAGGRTVAVPA